MSQPSLPSLFISHGPPDIVLGESPAKAAIAGVGELIRRPRGLVVVSAHWVASPVRVTTSLAPATLYDFDGFSPELRQLRYSAAGSEEISGQVLELLAAAGISAAGDSERGWDHGAWIPLMLAYPAADIPVVQVSLPNAGLDQVAALGRALEPLREKGILIIGSGGSVHNLRALSREEGVRPDDWAVQFEAWLQGCIEGNRFPELSTPARFPPTFLQAHPAPDHFAPLLFAWGAGGWDRPGRRLYQGFCLGNLGLSIYRFGDA
jgi:4,5-DOPA dioxygenase extradiol